MKPNKGLLLNHTKTTKYDDIEGTGGMYLKQSIIILCLSNMK